MDKKINSNLADRLKSMAEKLAPELWVDNRKQVALLKGAIEKLEAQPELESLVPTARGELETASYLAVLVLGVGEELETDSDLEPLMQRTREQVGICLDQMTEGQRKLEEAGIESDLAIQAQYALFIPDLVLRLRRMLGGTGERSPSPDIS